MTTPIQDVCSTGKQQSPISINSANTIKCGARCSLNFYYQTSKLTPVFDGQQVNLIWDAGSFVTYNNFTFELKYITFTIPGSHIIDDYTPSIEIQLFHQNPIDKSWLAVSIMGQLNDVNSTSSVFLNQISDQIPTSININSPKSITMASDWNPFTLIPDIKSFYTYSGSFFRSPCMEQVIWIVFDNEVNVSNRFYGILRSKTNNNNRPVQAINDRKVMYSPNSGINNNINYGPGLRCYTEAEFKKACSCATDTTDILTAKNRFYLIALGGTSITTIIILLVLWYYSRK